MGAYPGILAKSNGNSQIITLNLMTGYSPYFGPTPSWALGIVCTVSSGASLTYAVQITCDQTPSSTGNWNAHDTLTALTASANGNVAFPITGLRLNVTNYVSGSVNLGVSQWP
jgi:hypothetical protein